MKNALLMLPILLLATGMIPLWAQSFQHAPEQPSPGEAITLKYSPEGTELEGASTVNAVLFALKDGLPIAKEVELTLKDGAYSGVYTSPKEGGAVVAYFTDGENTDNNGGEGYTFMLYNSEKQVVPGAYANLANANYYYASLVKLSKDPERALGYLKKEFSNHPQSRENNDYYRNYVRITKAAGAENLTNQALAEAKKIQAMRQPSEDQLVRALFIYQALEKQAQVEPLRMRIAEKYPKGDIARDAAFAAFRNIEGLEAKAAHYQNYKQKWKADNEAAKSQLSSMAYRLASAYGKTENWEAFDSYAAQIDNARQKAGMLNSLAWNMAGGGLEGEADKPEQAAKLSKKSLELIKAAKDDSNAKPSYYTQESWEETVDRTYATYAATYALTQYKEGNYDQALKYQEKYREINGEGSAEANARYCAYLEKAGKPEAAIAELEKLIPKGKATPGMKAQYKRLFAAQYTPEEAAERMLAKMQEKALEKLKEDLREKMIDEEAPAFTLKNLEGEEVSLADLKGKVVVIDFWATWCGPCTASFPGMQRAVDKYGKDDDVVFLFVNTFERVDDKVKNAADFISENDYTFEVLMDLESKVVKEFGVRGIPTKFILGPNNRIRFKSVDFDGNDDKLVNELKMMIDMARETG